MVLDGPTVLIPFVAQLVRYLPVVTYLIVRTVQLAVGQYGIFILIC
jgi:hypothetical protein